MRISTGQIYETSAANYQRNYAKYVKTGEEVSSESKLNTASDNPVGAARVLQLAQQNAMLEQYANNITTVNNNTANTETAMTSITDALQRASELVISSGNGAQTDADRLSNAQELVQLQSQILGLMNSQDANGRYLFSGSDSAQPPYIRNSDGTYSYQGDQNGVSLAVGDGLVLNSITTGWEAFEQAVNTTRTSATLTNPATEDGKITLSSGSVSSPSTYNASYVAGQPYTLSFVDGPQILITDSTGKDVTADASTAGKFDYTSSASQTFTFRGVDMTLNVNLSAAEKASAGAAETALKDRTYQLASTPSSITPSRSPGNTSAATISQAAVGTTAADQALFNNAFPGGGAILKFTDSGYELYASPVSNGNPPVAKGDGFGPVISAAGASFTISGTPQEGDQFIIESNTHQTKNILNTLSDIITALDTKVDGDAVGLQKLQASLNSALGNLTSGREQLSTAISGSGARQKAAIEQGVTNEMIKGNNVTESETFTKSDGVEAATRLTLQQNMLQASQQVFLQASKLNLFSQI